MKIYISNIDLELISTKKLYDYKVSTNLIKYLYSSDGLYEITEQSIKKLIPHDYPIENEMIDNYSILIDNSFFKKSNIYQLPKESHLVNYNKFCYKLHKKSLISLILFYNTDIKKITDLYFETKEDYTNKFIQEDILTFLSYLK